MSPPLGLHPVCHGCLYATVHGEGCLALARPEVRAWSWGEPEHGGCPGRWTDSGTDSGCKRPTAGDSGREP
jgi:hypothetical protein